MLVHFVSGVAGGFGNVFFGFTVPRAFAVALGVMVVYELGEFAFGVRESWPNVLLDILVGLCGVALALGVARQLDARGERLAFWVSFATALAGSVAGWVAYRRRS
jgi:cytochrome bd-type quinol oxidase subunit 2